jgi:hypothetical protein
MKHKSVSRRIINIILVIFLLFGLSIVFNIISLSNSNRGLETYKKLSEDVNTLTEVETTFLEATLDFKDYLVAYENIFEESFKNNLSSINSFLDSLTGSSIEATNVTQVHSLMRQYNDSFNKINLVTVVFPLPLCPTNETISPFFIEKLILFTAFTAFLPLPNTFVRFSTLIISSVFCAIWSHLLSLR